MGGIFLLWAWVTLKGGGGDISLCFQSIILVLYYLEKYSCILQSGLGSDMFKCAEPSMVTQLNCEKHIYRRFDILQTIFFFPEARTLKRSFLRQVHYERR